MCYPQARLTRNVVSSTFHLTQIADTLKNKGVEPVVINQDIDTSTPTGKLMFTMFAVIAEFETELRKERQMEGIAKAKKNGVKFGAKAKLTEAMVAQMKTECNAGVLIKDLYFKYRISKASIYRLLAA